MLPVVVWLDLFLFGKRLLGSPHPKYVFAKRPKRLGCMLDFLADTLRLHSWITFSVIARVLGGINTMILFPVWLLWLGNMLPEIRRNFEASHDKSEEEAFVTGENQVT